MDEEKLNLSVRKFLKNVGISSQRLIEDKVREMIKSGSLQDSKSIKIEANILSDDLKIDEKISGQIEIEI
tara:strand:+ start:172 stop:381 length:210 start_codon:yes stop_codon:yes gene_type:complete